MPRGTSSPDGRYEPHEVPPLRPALGTAAQLVLMMIPRMILLPLLVVTLAGGRSLLESRVVLASLVVCGLLMLVMTVGSKRLRTENLYVPAVDPISVPFCIIALKDGGVGTLAALVAVTGCFQVIVGMRLSRLRRLVTPVVSGTLLVLSIISLVPVLAKAVGTGREGGRGSGVLVCMLVALVIMVAVERRGRASVKLWAAPVGMVVGIAVAMGFGLYDFDKVRAAPWFGLPRGGWRLFDPQVGNDPFGPAFFTLLPSFLILGLVVLIRTHGASILTQFVSWRRLLSIDFREVQRANTRLGLGSIASGLAGSLPVSASPMGIRFISQSRCASRTVGAMVAVPFLVIALFPKAWASVTAVPRSLVVVYFVFIMAPMLIRIAKSQKRSFRQPRNLVLLGVPVLAALIIEIGFVNFPDNAFWDAITRHGLLAGSILLVILALAFNATEHRRSIETKLSVTSLGAIRDFMRDFTAWRSWGEATAVRLDAVAEEALLVLTERVANSGDEDYRRLRISATARGSTVELEFVSGPTDAENLEDRIALLAGQESEISETEIERDVSLRLLQHYANSVNHRQYQEAEIITAVVSTGEDG